MPAILSKNDLEKLEALSNPKVMEYLNEAILLCRPEKVTVIDESEADEEYIRDLTIKSGEEYLLEKAGHTYHYDNELDHDWDRANTRYLQRGEDRNKGLEEIRGMMDGIMSGKEMLVSFFSLGPCNSRFSLKAMQITDSSYVAHSSMILYRPGYAEFKKTNGSHDFFMLLHSQGELENGVTKNIDKRRICIDLEENRAYSCNNQYLENSVGLMHPSFAMAVHKAQNEGWLAENMLITGIHNGKGRSTYMVGAFPDAGEKTATAMLPGETIVGDDKAYIRNIDGEVRGVSAGQGVFGIVPDVQMKEEALLFNAITSPREVIVSNVLLDERETLWFWLRTGEGIPPSGINYYGKWHEGIKDIKGSEAKRTNRNADYTMKIIELENADEKVNAPEGCVIKGIIYGGKDTDTTVPVAEAFSWNHGVYLGASIETEAIYQALGNESTRTHNPFANNDYITVPVSAYVRNHIIFGEKAKKAPKIYSFNCTFNEKTHKKVWLHWADGRVNNEFDAIETPVGFIPKYEDLRLLFKELSDYDYHENEYNEQFLIRIEKYFKKTLRMKAAFSKYDMPKEFIDEISLQIERLEAVKAKYGDVVLPEKLR